MTTSSPNPSAREALLRAAVEELVEKGHAAVSLRAVARRAGLSHAAPAHFFGDRAGMLTAVATDGFHRLAAALRRAGAADGATPEERFAALGLAYVDFGLTQPALTDLMFRRTELTPDDAGLAAAQREALAPLRDAVACVVGDPAREEWSMIGWAFVHGLVALVREESMVRVAELDPDRAADFARSLVPLFAAAVSASAVHH